MKSILKNKFSIWNKKVLPPPFFRIEFWLLEVLVSIFKVSHYSYPSYVALILIISQVKVHESFKIIPMYVGDFLNLKNHVTNLLHKLCNHILIWPKKILKRTFKNIIYIYLEIIIILDFSKIVFSWNWSTFWVRP